MLIRVAGSHAIGLGHVYRMRTLALAARAEGWDVAFFSAYDPIAGKLLKATGLPCHFHKRRSWRNALRNAVRNHPPDVVVNDTLATKPQLMSDLRRLTSASIVSFDDVGAGPQMADVVINGCAFHPRASRARLFEGPRYAILPPQISRYATRARKCRPRGKNVLLAFGGTDTRQITARALEAINRISPGLRVRVNLGPGTPSTPRLLRTAKASPHHVRILRHAPDLFAEMWKADLVVCAGGNMLGELAAMSVPSVAIAAERHEIANIRYWAAAGSTVCGGWEHTLSLPHFVCTVEEVLRNPQQRARLSQHGRAAVDGMGLRRVLKILAKFPRQRGVR